MHRLHNENEAAELLGCTVSALRKWRTLGKGPAFCRVGRLVRYSELDLSAFLDANRVQPVGGGQ
jgi:DNA-binding transcriptional MerR regulator